MKIFHGSENRIEKPEYGKGKPYNDYGLGFYCTEDIEMAKEWSCGEDHDGFANEYTLDITGLKVLNLNAPEYTILHWLAVLLKNRTFRLTNPIAKDAKEYLLEHFPVNTEDYDIIIGYRADDSYFSFAEAQPHGFLRRFQPAGGGGGSAVQRDFRGGGEVGSSPVEGGFRLAVRVVGKQRHLQLLHSVTVVVTDECQIHKIPCMLTKIGVVFLFACQHGGFPVTGEHPQVGFDLGQPF